jgi:hypothetical protein
MTEIAKLDDYRKPADSTARTPEPSRSGGSPSITVNRLDDDGAVTATLSFSGRDAWALDQLVSAGVTGITSIDNPAPRIAHYIFMHGRYVLRSKVRVIENTFDRKTYLA